MEGTAKAEAVKDVETWSDGDYYNISFSIGKSRRYHAKMADFYRLCHHTVVASSALTGTSAFVALFSGNPEIAQWLTGVVACASTLDLVFAFSERADKQENLRRGFTELAARMVEWQATPEKLARARAERLRLEAEDSGERRLVDLQAENEESRARGVSPEELVPLSQAQRWFGYIATFGMNRLENWHNQRQLQRQSSHNDHSPASAATS